MARRVWPAGVPCGDRVKVEPGRYVRPGRGQAGSRRWVRKAVGVMPVQHHLKPDAAALGNWLRSHKERRVGKLRFRKQDATGSTATLWWVEEG